MPPTRASSPATPLALLEAIIPALILSLGLGSCALLVGAPPELPHLQVRTLGPGDLVAIRDRAAPEPPLHVLEVAADGNLDPGGSLGLGPLPVWGYTPEDLEAVLLSLLDDASRELNVELLSPPRSYYLYGEVKRSGRRDLKGHLTLLDALVDAKALPASADLRRVRVFRGKAGGSAEVTVDVQDLLEGGEGDGSSNLQLRDGDVVLVPPARQERQERTEEPSPEG